MYFRMWKLNKNQHSQLDGVGMRSPKIFDFQTKYQLEILNNRKRVRSTFWKIFEWIGLIPLEIWLFVARFSCEFCVPCISTFESLIFRCFLLSRNRYEILLKIQTFTIQIVVYCFNPMINAWTNAFLQIVREKEYTWIFLIFEIWTTCVV